MVPIKIEHIAIWTHQQEILKEFYTAYFQGEAGAMYHNKKKNFLSYFLTFGDGARLEIMSAPDNNRLEVRGYRKIDYTCTAPESHKSTQTILPD